MNCYVGAQYRQVKAWYFQSFDANCAFLERQLATGAPFFGGETPTHADFNVYHMLSNAQLAEPHCVSGPLAAFMQEVEALPRVKEFLETRPSLVDIGEDPALLDSAGRRISQKDPPGLAFLSSSGLFSEDPPSAL